MGLNKMVDVLLNWILKRIALRDKKLYFDLNHIQSYSEGSKSHEVNIGFGDDFGTVLVSSYYLN